MKNISNCFLMKILPKVLSIKAYVNGKHSDQPELM